ncbi:MAG: DUF1549 domain-containing protein [Acidobacteria bacterium]|nr:DUF1549 domain-containing protein [Acidobacteriota bacterium]
MRIPLLVSVVGLQAALAAPPAPQNPRKQVPAKVVSLRVLPAGPTLRGAGTAVRFLAMAKYTDGVERDVTALAEPALSDPKVAEVGPGGRVVAKADGETVLRARFGGHTAQTRVKVIQADKPRPFSFAREVGGILTKKGCNTSDCHGGVKGQGGLKLSGNATQPKDDYHYIVKGGVFQVLTTESGGPVLPRIDPKDPEKSLLLLKPSMQVPHGGGQRFAKGSPDYDRLLAWVRQGAPFGEESTEAAVRTESVEVLPGETILDASGRQQLIVLAKLSDGTVEDVTTEASYTVSDIHVAKVNADGLATAMQPGETAVVVRAAGHAVSQMVSVVSKPAPDYPAVKSYNYIDDHILAKLRKLNIVPSGLATDSEFLRRVCLDLAGTLPPPERVREFLASKNPRKRELLIDALLDSPEFVEFWTFRLGEILRYRARSTQLMKDTQIYGEWIRESVAANKPFDRIVRERIAAEGYAGPSRYYYELRFLAEPPEIIAEQTRLFLGRRIECARCHNHPFESWSQDQFWGLAAFYGSMVDLRNSVMDDSVVIDVPEAAAKVIHPRTKKTVQPRFLDGTALAKEAQEDPRRNLAEWVTAHPYFAETLANRAWDWFFGRGIVEPVDDFRSTNPATHPELLAAMAKDIREHGYDLKYLMKLIVSSRTYQTSGIPNETNRGDRTNWSHVVPKALEAAVLLDAIATVTGVREQMGEMPLQSRAIEICPDMVESKFLEAYGRNDRATLPEAKPQPGLVQALHMITGPTYTTKMLDDGGRIDRMARSGVSNRQAIEDLYLTALARFPEPAEIEQLDTLMRSASSRKEAIFNLMWALVSSRGFAYRH